MFIFLSEGPSYEKAQKFCEHPLWIQVRARLWLSLETTTLYYNCKWNSRRKTHFTSRCCCDPFRKRTGCKVPSSRSRLNHTSDRLNCLCSDTPTATFGGSPRRTALAKVTSHGRLLFPWSSLAVNITVFVTPNPSVINIRIYWSLHRLRIVIVRQKKKYYEGAEVNGCWNDKWKMHTYFIIIVIKTYTNQPVSDELFFSNEAFFPFAYHFFFLPGTQWEQYELPSRIDLAFGTKLKIFVPY